MAETKNRQLGRYIASVPVGARVDTECPPMPDLSRFMDGQCTNTEKDRITKHLNRCHTCYTLYSEVLATNEELESIHPLQPADHRNGILRLINSLKCFIIQSPFKPLKIWVGIPAIVILLFIVVSVFKPGAPPAYETLVASLTEGPPSHQLTKQLRAIKHKSAVYGFYDGLSLERAAFRIGVLTCTLEIAVRAGDAEQSMTILKPLLSLLHEIDKQERVAREFDLLKSQLETGSFPRNLTSHTRKIPPLLQQHGVSFFMMLGVWVQGGSLAASLQNNSFFRLADVRYFIEGIGRLDLPPGISARLASVRQLMEKGDFDENDYQRMHNEFEAIIQILM